LHRHHEFFGWDVSNALWPNVGTNNLTAQGMGTADAAGLPIAPLLVNADEVIGTGTPNSPKFRIAVMVNTDSGATSLI